MKQIVLERHRKAKVISNIRKSRNYMKPLPISSGTRSANPSHSCDDA